MTSITQAAIYARVSSDQQAAAHTVESQLAALRERVIGAANPYDPQWEIYFERRLDVKMAANLSGSRTLLYLWKQQNGSCPVCNQKITKISGWHSHHLIYRVHGGKDGAENRVLLHPNCPRQVHSQKLKVEKPRAARRVREA